MLQCCRLSLNICSAVADCAHNMNLSAIIVNGIAHGFADQFPVRYVIDGTDKPRGVDKSFHHQEWETETIQPVTLYPTAAQGENLGGKIFIMAVGQYQET